MIDAMIKMTSQPDKLKEILQTLKAILVQIRYEQGCISCHCYVDVEVENNIFFREEWKTRGDLETHLRSVHFGILMGAMKLLSKEPAISFNTIVSTVEEEAALKAVEAARL